MEQLWKQRFARHLQEQFKYLRLVFNDHFVIALIFLFGALGVAYSNVLKQLTTNLWWSKPAIIIVFTLALSIGKIATLVEKPDDIFLLPKENAFFSYLLKARRYSLILPMVTLMVLLTIALPFMVTAAGLNLTTILCLVVTVLVLKDSQLWLRLMQAYQGDQQPSWLNLPIFYGMSLVVLAASIYVWPFIGVIVAVLCDGWLRLLIPRWLAESNLAWEQMISDEGSRGFTIYRFYNLFTDVPGMGGQVKRRRYLDGFLKPIRATHKNTYLYLFARGFLRGTEYSGLFLRLVVIGALILYFVHNFWLSMILLLVFIYLVGFQLLPFYSQYDSIVLTRLYPLTTQLKLRAFQRLVLILLMIQWILLAVAVGIAFMFSTNAWLIIAAGLVETLGFVFWYLPLRFKQTTK